MWVNISQAAKLTGYKYSEIRRLITKGAFPFYHNGKKAFKFELEDLKTAMKAEMAATQAAAKKSGKSSSWGRAPLISREEWRASRRRRKWISGNLPRKSGAPAASSKAGTAGMSSTSRASSNGCKKRPRERMRRPKGGMKMREKAMREVILAQHDSIRLVEQQDVLKGD